MKKSIMKYFFILILNSFVSFSQVNPSQIGSSLSGTMLEDRFGFSVSLSDDGLRLAIGAPYHDDLKGKVYIYHWEETDWVFKQSFIESSVNSEFGYDVALSGDGNTLAVGAPGYDNGSITDVGKTTIYSFINNSWSQTKVIIGDQNFDRSNSYMTGDYLNNLYSGFALDLNFDGTILLFTEPGWNMQESTSWYRAGRTLLYRKLAGVWTHSPSPTVGGVSENYISGGGRHYAGSDVSINRDGKKIALSNTGWYWYNNANVNYVTGRSKLFEYTAGATNDFSLLDQRAYWGPSNEDKKNHIGGEGTTHGYSLSVSDNGRYLVVGEPSTGQSHQGGPNTGGIRVFDYLNVTVDNGVAWSSSLNGPHIYENFGISQKISGNGKHLLVTSSDHAYFYGLTFPESGISNGVNADFDLLHTFDSYNFYKKSPHSNGINFESIGYRIKIGGNKNNSIDIDNKGRLVAVGSLSSTTSFTGQVVIYNTNIAPSISSLSSSDADNIVTYSDNITITAIFDADMATAPNITIGSLVSNEAMTAVSSTTWTYLWTVPAGYYGAVNATIAGNDIAGNTYSGSDNLVFNINDSPTDVLLSDTGFDGTVNDGATIGTLATLDVDISDGDTHTYSFISGDGGEDNSSFEIDNANSLLKFNSSVDFDVKKSYYLLIRSTDVLGASFTKAITVSILKTGAAYSIAVNRLNDAPTDINLTTNAINENVISGSTIGNLSSIDVDTGDAHSYTLTDTANYPDNSSFSISGTTLLTNTNLDFETKSNYTVLIQTFDGTDTFSKTFTISINDINDTPTDINLSANAINENVALGSTIGNLSSIDQDTGDNHSYTLTNTTSYPDNSSFNISGTTLLTNTNLDFEAKPNYTVLIQTFDGTDAYSKTFTISVNDVNDAPIAIADSYTVIEDAVLTSVNVIVNDTDVDTATSTLILTAVSTSGSGTIAINPDNKSVDYTPATNFFGTEIITYTVSDGSLSDNTGVLTITVLPNSAPTNITLTANTISENNASGVTIGALTTTDSDSGDTHTYTFADTANYPDNSNFSIGGANLQAAAVFDYETKASYVILVQTTDTAGATYTKTFTISITDVDEDSDGDGINNSVDNCPSVANASQEDADGDGIGDVCDNAPNIPNPSQTDTDDDGIGDAADTDDDADGVPDTEDAFPLDASENTDTDGDGTGDNVDLDDDNDGVPDASDNAPLTPNIDQLDTDSDGIGDIEDPDDDNDGYSDADEITCGSDPLLAASLPADTDSDGIPDCLDTDDDNDGYSDTDELNCDCACELANKSENTEGKSNPLDPSITPLDTDGDFIPNCYDTDDDNDGYSDENDAFPLDASEWLDTDADGIGNNTDTDNDNDGQSDDHEMACGSGPLDGSETSADADADGLPDCVDTDDDNDGVEDTSDAFPLDPSEWTDTDADSIGNNADTDDDNDGYSDLDELSCDSDPLDRFNKPSDQDGDLLPDCIDSDRDGDGVLNTQDVFPDDSNEWADTDGDGLGDNFEVDKDGDGVLDSMDAFPLDPFEWADTDLDGIGDNADTDIGNDGFPDEELVVSGILTPNSSGSERFWKVINLEKYPINRVAVFDKNGVPVFSTSNYQNNWSGTFKNSPLPAGSYYYIIKKGNGEMADEGWLYITY